MDLPAPLDSLDREALVALVREFAAVNAKLAAHIAELEARLNRNSKKKAMD